MGGSVWFPGSGFDFFFFFFGFFFFLCSLAPRIVYLFIATADQTPSARTVVGRFDVLVLRVFLVMFDVR